MPPDQHSTTVRRSFSFNYDRETTVNGAPKPNFIRELATGMHRLFRFAKPKKDAHRTNEARHFDYDEGVDAYFRALLHNVPFSDTVKADIRKRRDLANAIHVKLKHDRVYTQYRRKLEDTLEQYHSRIAHLARRAAGEFPRDAATLEEEVQEVSERLDSVLRMIAENLDETAASEMGSLRNRAFLKGRDLANNLSAFFDSRLP